MYDQITIPTDDFGSLDHDVVGGCSGSNLHGFTLLRTSYTLFGQYLVHVQVLAGSMMAKGFKTKITFWSFCPFANGSDSCDAKLNEREERVKRDVVGSSYW